MVRSQVPRFPSPTRSATPDSFLLKHHAETQKTSRSASPNSHRGTKPEITGDSMMVNHARTVPKKVAENVRREAAFAPDKAPKPPSPSRLAAAPEASKPAAPAVARVPKGSKTAAAPAPAPTKASSAPATKVLPLRGRGETALTGEAGLLTPRSTDLLGPQSLDTSRREDVFSHAAALEKQGRQRDAAALVAVMLERHHQELKPAASKMHRPTTKHWPPQPQTGSEAAQGGGASPAANGARRKSNVGSWPPPGGKLMDPTSTDDVETIADRALPLGWIRGAQGKAAGGAEPAAAVCAPAAAASAPGAAAPSEAAVVAAAAAAAAHEQVAAAAAAAAAAQSAPVVEGGYDDEDDTPREGLGGARGCCGSWEQAEEMASAAAKLSDAKLSAVAAEHSLLREQSKPSAQAAGLVDGHWEGHSMVQGERVVLAMELFFSTSDAETSISGSGVDSQGGFDVRGATLPNGRIRMQKQWRDTPHQVEFTGAFFGGKIAGNWKEGEHSGAFVLAWKQEAGSSISPKKTFV